jgi:hypothetical protein
VYGFPARVSEGEVEVPDDQEGLAGGLGLGKANNALIDATTEDGGGLVDFFPAVLAEHLEVRLIYKLHNFRHYHNVIG